VLRYLAACDRVFSPKMVGQKTEKR